MTNKPFLCQFPGCSRSYYHIRSLRKHERTHPGWETLSYNQPLLQSTQTNTYETNTFTHQTLNEFWSK